MATVNISYFNPSYSGGAAVISALDVDTSQTLTTTSTSSQSDVINYKSLCRITTTGNIYVTFGANPTATPDNSFLILANSTEYFSIPSGYRVAVRDV